MLAALSLAWATSATAAEPTKIAVLDASMTFGSVEQPITEHEQARLERFSSELRHALERSDNYELVDHADLQALTKQHVGGRRINSCDSCQARIGRDLGADRVIMPVADKMSELIMSLRVEIRNTETGEPVGVRSVRIAGNTDESWRRGRIAIHRDMDWPAPEEADR
nr:DUF2380 domain-containing protein [Methylonatrum kenyense]